MAVAAVVVDVGIVVVVARFVVPHFPANKIPFRRFTEREREKRDSE